MAEVKKLVEDVARAEDELALHIAAGADAALDVRSVGAVGRGGSLYGGMADTVEAS